jgi:hypothetical protein
MRINNINPNPAMAKRMLAMLRGGKLSRANFIPRYVEPQIV